jgi:hypothetical protein
VFLLRILGLIFTLWHRPPPRTRRSGVRSKSGISKPLLPRPSILTMRRRCVYLISMFFFNQFMQAQRPLKRKPHKVEEEEVRSIFFFSETHFIFIHRYECHDGNLIQNTSMRRRRRCSVSIYICFSLLIC